jgi:hypothetical protein
MHPLLQERELQTAFMTNKSNSFTRPPSGSKGMKTAMSMTNQGLSMINTSPGKESSLENQEKLIEYKKADARSKEENLTSNFVN